MELTVGTESDTAEPLGDFDTFFLTNFERVARSAAFVAGDVGTGQDVAQEAFTRLLERWQTMASEDHARNFAYRVAVNLARSHLRKHLRVSLYGLHRREERSPSDDSDPSDDWIDIAQALTELPRRQRACVVLVDYADMDAGTVAKILGVSPSTVRVHVMRGRRALRLSFGLGLEEERP